MAYNYEIIQIEYDDDEGYQRTISQLFFMEAEFDNEIIDRTLDQIYLKTKAHPLFPHKNQSNLYCCSCLLLVLPSAPSVENLHRGGKQNLAFLVRVPLYFYIFPNFYIPLF